MAGTAKEQCFGGARRRRAYLRKASRVYEIWYYGDAVTDYSFDRFQDRRHRFAHDEVFANAGVNRDLLGPRHDPVGIVDCWSLNEIAQCGHRLKVMVTMDHIGNPRQLAQSGF